MSALASLVRKGVAVVAFVVLPLSAHIAMATRHGAYWAGLLISAEAAAFAGIALSLVLLPGFRWINAFRVAGCIAIFALTMGVSSIYGIVAASAIPHAIVYLSLLVAFGASLRAGRKPIITVFAEKSRGTLAPSLALYTRRVTWAWCLFCGGQILGSVLLLSLAPITVWSTFLNLCNVPLLVAMFCGEFAWRKWRHGSAPWERLSDAFRMTGQVKAAAGDERR